MKMITSTIFAILALSCGSSSSSSTQCEEARKSITSVIDDVCQDKSYSLSQFCTVCVSARLHSFTSTSAGDCVCRTLTFDQDSCGYTQGNDAVAAVRGAIDFADRSCTVFAVPEKDASAPDTASGTASESIDASSPIDSSNGSG